MLFVISLIIWSIHIFRYIHRLFFEYNWSNMPWYCFEGSWDILSNIVIVELFIFLKMIEDQVLLNSGLYISLILIEDQSLFEFWAVYCYEIDRISESCWMLFLFVDHLLVGKYNTWWECWTGDIVSLQIKYTLYL